MIARSEFAQHDVEVRPDGIASLHYLSRQAKRRRAAVKDPRVRTNSAHGQDDDNSEDDPPPAGAFHNANTLLGTGRFQPRDPGPQSLAVAFRLTPGEDGFELGDRDVSAAQDQRDALARQPFLERECGGDGRRAGTLDQGPVAPEQEMDGG